MDIYLQPCGHQFTCWQMLYYFSLRKESPPYVPATQGTMIFSMNVLHVSVQPCGCFPNNR